jgi:hypothetical protein
MLRLVFQGENLDTSLAWLDPVMAALKCRSVPEGIVVEEPHHPCGVMRSLVQIWSML